MPLLVRDLDRESESAFMFNHSCSLSYMYIIHYFSANVNGFCEINENNCEKVLLRFWQIGTQYQEREREKSRQQREDSQTFELDRTQVELTGFYRTMNATENFTTK